MSELDTFKVKLRRPPFNFSNNDVDSLCLGVTDIRQLKEMKKIVELACAIVCDGYTNNVLTQDAKVLVHNLLKTLVAHEQSNLTEFWVVCKKYQGSWQFTIGEK